MRRPLPAERRVPLISRLPREHPAYPLIDAAHEEAMQRGRPGYIDPLSGYFVFTAAEHWERGTCCASGCRHCPYAAGPREVGGAELGVQPEPGTE